MQEIRPSDVLKIMSTFGKGSDQNINLKSAPNPENLKNEDSDEDEDDDDDDDENQGMKALGTDAMSNQGGVQGGVQVGTPLPNVGLVKDLLQAGTAQDPDQNAQAPDQNAKAPTMASPLIDYYSKLQSGLLQQNTGILPQQAFQQQLLSNAQLGTTQGNVNQNPLFSAPANADLLPGPGPNQLSSAGNANVGGTMGSMVQPIVLSPSLLNQAIFGAGKGKGVRKDKSKPSQRKHLNDPRGKSPGSPLDPLSIPGADASSSIGMATPTFQAGPLNPGVTSSMPILPLLFRQQTEVQDSVPAQFQSLLPPAMRLSNPGFSPLPNVDKRAPFEDEYKYDRLDQQGEFLFFGFTVLFIESH